MSEIVVGRTQSPYFLVFMRLFTCSLNIKNLNRKIVKNQVSEFFYKNVTLFNIIIGFTVYYIFSQPMAMFVPDIKKSHTFLYQNLPFRQ